MGGTPPLVSAGRLMHSGECILQSAFAEESEQKGNDMTMNPEIKARWVAALRSGEYPQGKHALRTAEGYCCLGVLCDLAVRAGVIEAHEPDSDSWGYGDNRESQTLPYQVARWAGLGMRQNPHLNVTDIEGARYNEAGKYGTHPPIADVNDHGTPFTVIADIIEREL